MATENSDDPKTDSDTREAKKVPEPKSAVDKDSSEGEEGE